MVATLAVGFFPADVPDGSAEMSPELRHHGSWGRNIPPPASRSISERDGSRASAVTSKNKSSFFVDERRVAKKATVTSDDDDANCGSSAETSSGRNTIRRALLWGRREVN